MFPVGGGKRKRGGGEKGADIADRIREKVDHSHVQW